jgi:hypothetical protein
VSNLDTSCSVDSFASASIDVSHSGLITASWKCAQESSIVEVFHTPGSVLDMRDSVDLNCPPGQKITSIDFASWGSRSYKDTDAKWQHATKSLNVTEFIGKQCLKQPTCKISTHTPQLVLDVCPKCGCHLHVIASCRSEKPKVFFSYNVSIPVRSEAYITLPIIGSEDMSKFGIKCNGKLIFLHDRDLLKTGNGIQSIGYDKNTHSFIVHVLHGWHNFELVHLTDKYS